MNTMIQRIAEAVRKAIDEAPYVVKPLGWNTSAVSFTWGVLDNVTTLDVFTDPEAAEVAMDKLNDAWIARKMVESMKVVTGEIFNSNDPVAVIELDKIWSRMIDNILKE